MSTEVRHRRGTTVQHSTFTGADGEITVDTTKKVAVVHDGVTAGGTPLAKESALSGKAVSGANSDITSLSGLTTALSVAQGGTGAISALAARASLGVAQYGLIDRTVVATGTANAITAVFSPAITTFDNGPVFWRALGDNTTTTPTFQRNGLVAKTLVKGNNLPLEIGDIPGAGCWMCSMYDVTLDKEVLLNPAHSVSPSTVPVKNFLINGQMIVDQFNVGASQTYTAAAAIAYNVDMWYGSCTGANITGARLSAITGGYRYTGATSNTGTLHGTRIRGINSAPLVNQSVTGQIKVSSSSITSVTWNAYSANALDTFSTKTLIATGTLTITSTPTNYSFTFNAGANAANGIALEFVTGALLGTQTLTYERAKLGDISVFQETPYDTILANCKPYAQPFRMGYLGDSATIGNSYGEFVNFPVEMWAVPTVTLLSDVISPSGFNPYPAGTTIAVSATGCGATRTATSSPVGGAQWAGNYFAFARL